MGCGVSKETATAVLDNATTHNGSAHHNSNGSDANNTRKGISHE